MITVNTVSHTVQNDLCISCGFCKAVCPKQCIAYHMQGGLPVPHIDESKCIACGKCLQICPGKGFDYTKYIAADSLSAFWIGNYREIYSAHTTDPLMLKDAASGGIVTELVRRLLDDGEYAAAFLVGTYHYDEPISTRKYVRGMSLDHTSRSRYLPVSQEEAVSYLVSHPSDRVILVGTGCFVHGILNLIEAYHLDRDNYLIIGLFCDRTQSYNVIRYFNDHPSLKQFGDMSRVN